MIHQTYFIYSNAPVNNVMFNQNYAALNTADARKTDCILTLNWPSTKFLLELKNPSTNF